MDLEKLLNSVPVARRRVPLFFSVVWFILFPVIPLLVITDRYALDAVLLLDMLLFLAFAPVVSILTYLFFIPTLKRAKLALKKASHMFECISKLSYDQQQQIKSEVANDLGRTWRDNSYLMSKFEAFPKFGRDCLYGKVFSNKTFAMNQHVILPYQNIAEVITPEPESRKNEVIRNTTNVVSTAANVLSVFTGGQGGAFRFISKRPTIVVVDDAGNSYQIDCADEEAFLKQLEEKIGAMQVIT